jgi:hypothetical protein
MRKGLLPLAVLLVGGIAGAGDAPTALSTTPPALGGEGPRPHAALQAADPFPAPAPAVVDPRMGAWFQQWRSPLCPPEEGRVTPPWARPQGAPLPCSCCVGKHRLFARPCACSGGGPGE